MTRLILALALVAIGTTAQAQGIKLAICPGEFALCAASPTTRMRSPKRSATSRTCRPMEPVDPRMQIVCIS